MEIEIYQIAVGIVSCIVIYIIYWLWFVPMNRIRSWYEVGFNHLVDGKKVS